MSISISSDSDSGTIMQRSTRGPFPDSTAVESSDSSTSNTGSAGRQRSPRPSLICCCRDSLSPAMAMPPLVVTPHEARILIKVTFTTSLMVLVLQRVDEGGNGPGQDDGGSGSRSSSSYSDNWSQTVFFFLCHMVVDMFKSAVFTLLVMSFFLRKSDYVSWEFYVSFLFIAVLLGMVVLGGFAVMVTAVLTLTTLHLWKRLFLHEEMMLANERQKQPPKARVKALDQVWSSSNNNGSKEDLLLAGYYTGHVVLWRRHHTGTGSCYDDGENRELSECNGNKQPRQKRPPPESSSTATAVATASKNDFNHQQQQQQQQPIRSVQFLKSRSNFFVAASDEGCIHLFKWTSTSGTSRADEGVGNSNNIDGATTRMKLISTVRAHDDFIRCVKYIHYDREQEQRDYLLSCSDDITIKLWLIDVVSNSNTIMRCLRTFQGQHEHYIMHVAVHPCTNSSLTFASCSLDSAIKVWHIDFDDIGSNSHGSCDSTDACVTGTLVGHERSVNCIAFSPSSKYLISGSDDRTVKIWDYEKQMTVQTLKGHEEGITSTACLLQQEPRDFDIRRSNNIPTIVSASEDGTCRLWDGRTGACHSVINFGMGRAWTLIASQLSPSTSRLVVGNDEGLCCVDLREMLDTDNSDDLEQQLCGDEVPLRAQPSSIRGWKLEHAVVLSEVDMATNCAEDVSPEIAVAGRPVIKQAAHQNLFLDYETRYDENKRQFNYVTARVPAV